MTASRKNFSIRSRLRISFDEITVDSDYSETEKEFVMAKGRLPAGEKKRRVRYAYQLLSAGFTTSEMLETITRRFAVAEFAARAYVAEAKKIMLADNGLTL